MTLRSFSSFVFPPRLRLPSLAVLALTVFSSAFLFLPRQSAINSPPRPSPSSMAARSFVLWLHGLGDSGPANEPIRTFFSSPEFKLTKWAFPSAPHSPVSCNYGAIMPSWFDIHEIPVAAESPKGEEGVLKAENSFDSDLHLPPHRSPPHHPPPIRVSTYTPQFVFTFANKELLKGSSL